MEELIVKTIDEEYEELKKSKGPWKRRKKTLAEIQWEIGNKKSRKHGFTNTIPYKEPKKGRYAEDIWAKKTKKIPPKRKYAEDIWAKK